MKNSQIKIDFFINQWENLISNFLNKSFGLNLYSPRILIEDIIVEIEENSFKNPDNRKFFYNKISYYLKEDEIIKKEIKTQFTLLRKQFNTNRLGYILELCKDIKKEFEKGLYFQYSLEMLINVITSEDEVSNRDIKKIQTLTENIIVELIKKGYHLEDIKGFTKQIFARTSKYPNIDLSIVGFFHNIDISKYCKEDGTTDMEAYNKALNEFIDNLSTKDRLLKLSDFYNKESETVYYIFYIEGIVGSIDISILDVTLYSLDKKQFVTDKVGLGSETLNLENLQREEKEKYIQAAVSVEYLLPKSSKIKALSKLENVLNLIACYFPTKTELRIINSKYLIIDKNGRIKQLTGEIDSNHPLMTYQNSLNINEIENIIELNQFSFLKDSLENKSVSKIINALHWYRKGKESFKQEDKILNYWIAIENLFNFEKNIRIDILNDENKNKTSLIQEIISSLQVFDFIFNYGWELYNHYYSIVTKSVFYITHNFSEELIKRAQLAPKEGEPIYLKNFIDCLPEIKKIEKNPFFIEKIESTYAFYYDTKTTKENIEKHINQVKDDILMIYRFRNLIVHNAHFDNTLLQYYAWKVKGFASNLITRVISNYALGKDLSDIMIQIYLKKEKFMNDFEQGNINLFNDIDH